MQFLNPSIRPNSGHQVPSSKISPKNETKPQEKQELKEMPLTKENLEALSNVDTHARAALLDQNTHSEISDLTTRDSNSVSGSTQDDRSVSSLTGSTKTSTSSEITIAGGRGLVGPDKKGAINKEATCRELLNLLKLSETDLKPFLPTFEDGIWVQTNPDAPQDAPGKPWTTETLTSSGWKKMDAKEFKEYMESNRKGASDTLNIKMGLAGSGDFGNYISDIKLGTFPTPHMDRGTGRDSTWRHTTYKLSHESKTGGVTSAQYKDKDSGSVKSFGKGSDRESLEQSQTPDMVLNDVIMTNMTDAYESKFGQETATDAILTPIKESLSTQLKNLNEALNSVQDNFYPAGMSILVAYDFNETTKEMNPVIKLIDPDNCMFIDNSNKGGEKETAFLNAFTEKATSMFSLGSSPPQLKSGSVRHTQQMALDIYNENGSEHPLNLQNPYLETVRGGIDALIIGLNKAPESP